MTDYLKQYGFHFNKKTCDLAISLMRKKNATTGKPEKIEPWTKDQVEELLLHNGVKIDNSHMYDVVYVANMLKADCYKSSLEDDKHIALGIKDRVDDVDSSPENIFRGWLACMVGNGRGVEWSDML